MNFQKFTMLVLGSTETLTKFRSSTIQAKCAKEATLRP